MLSPILGTQFFQGPIQPRAQALFSSIKNVIGQSSFICVDQLQIERAGVLGEINMCAFTLHQEKPGYEAGSDIWHYPWLG